MGICEAFFQPLIDGVRVSKPEGVFVGRDTLSSTQTREYGTQTELDIYDDDITYVSM